jgi:hypothetical protein
MSTIGAIPLSLKIDFFSCYLLATTFGSSVISRISYMHSNSSEGPEFFGLRYPPATIETLSLLLKVVFTRSLSTEGAFELCRLFLVEFLDGGGGLLIVGFLV